MSCLFCSLSVREPSRVIAKNEVFFAVWDGYPVAQGHALVIPLRHTLSWCDLSEYEIPFLHALMRGVMAKIEHMHQPDGFTIGVNEGSAAGRTVHHLHVHIIPRYVGDVENPRGGVRNVIPGKGDY